VRDGSYIQRAICHRWERGGDSLNGESGASDRTAGGFEHRAAVFR